MNAKRKHIPVRLSGLVDGHHELTYSVPPADIELPEEFGVPVEVNVDLDKSHSQSALNVTIDTEAVYPCDRCLDPVRLSVHAQFTVIYTHDNAEAQPDDTEIRQIDVNDPIIDLAEDVRDAALLCIPMRHICGEDAAGNPLCARPIPDEHDAEKAERSDPRWDALKSLKLDQ